MLCTAEKWSSEQEPDSKAEANYKQRMWNPAEAKDTGSFITLLSAGNASSTLEQYKVPQAATFDNFSEVYSWELCELLLKHEEADVVDSKPWGVESTLKAAQVGTDDSEGVVKGLPEHLWSPPMNIKGGGKIVEKVLGPNKRRAPEVSLNLVQSGGYGRASVGVPMSKLRDCNQRLRFSPQQQQSLQSFGAKVDWMGSGVEAMQEAHELCTELSIDIKQLKKWISNHRPRELQRPTVPNQVMQQPWVENHLPYPMYVSPYTEACPKGMGATTHPGQNIYPVISHPPFFGCPPSLNGTGSPTHHDQRAQAMWHSAASGCQVPALGVPFLELNHVPAEDSVRSAGLEGCSLDGADMTWQEDVELGAKETQDQTNMARLANADNLRQVLRRKMKDLCPDKVQKLVDLCKSYRQELKCIAQEVPSNTPPWSEQLVSPPKEKGEPLSTPWLNFEEATPQHNDNILEEVLLGSGGHHYDEASLLDFPTALAVSCCQPEDSSLAWYDGAENDTGVQFRGPSGGTPCLTVTRRTPMKRKRKPTVLVRRMDASSSQITKPKVERASNAPLHRGQRPVTSQPMRGKFLFEKVLTASDTGPLGRIVLSKSQAELHLPKLLDKDGRLIRVEDANGGWWQLRYRFWPNNKSQIYVLEHTAPFVQAHGLRLGDSLFVCRADEGHLVLNDYHRPRSTEEEPSD